MQELVATPVGDARITRFPAAGAGRRRALLVLGHGAGGGIQAPDLQALAAALPARGVEVALVEQPWRVAGKKIAAPPKTLDTAWEPVIEHLRKEAGAAGPATHRSSRSSSASGHDDGGVPLIAGGRSAGARVACRTGLATGAHGVLALAFPFHPPGKPEKSRAAELLETGLPTLIVQGATDPFGSAAQFPALPTTHQLVALPAGNHEFAVRKGDAPVLDAITDAVAAWIDGLVGA